MVVLASAASDPPVSSNPADPGNFNEFLVGGHGDEYSEWMAKCLVKVWRLFATTQTLSALKSFGKAHNTYRFLMRRCRTGMLKK